MAIVTKKGKRLLSTKRTRIGIDAGGTAAGAYRELVGIGGVAHTVGDRSVETVAFFGDSAAETGERTPAPFTVDQPTLLDHMPVYRALQAADASGRPVRVVVECYGYEIIGKPAAAPTSAVAIPAAGAQNIAKGGLLTIAGATGVDDLRRAFLTDQIQLGDILWYGGAIVHDTDISDDAKIVNRIEYDDAAPLDGDPAKHKVFMADADGSDATVHAAAAASWRTAGYRREFLANVGQEGSFEGEASGSPALGGGMTFQPITNLAPRELILYEEAGSGW